MKVLLVNKFHYLRGGSERYCFTLADAFKSMGHQVVFFSMKDGRNIPCAQEKYFVNNASVDGGIKSKLNMVLNIAYSKEAYKKMTLLLNDEKPDLVILNLVHKQLTCSVIDAIRNYSGKLPVFWTVHDMIFACPAYTMVDRHGNICEKCLGSHFENCKKNRCIHGSKIMSLLSTYEANQIKKRNWYNKVNLFICPSFFYKTKLEEASFTKSKIIWMKNPLPLDTTYELNDKDDGYILYFGRLSPEKGIKTLINAMKEIDTKLEIIGSGPIENELKDYVANNGMDNVKFEGFKFGEELKNYIRKARCIVLPSEWYENGPYSVMEAMALGKPLVVSNYGGLPELVDDNVNGKIFKSPSELAEKIKEILLLGEREYSSMCKASLKKAKESFSPINYVNKLISLFRHL